MSFACVCGTEHGWSDEIELALRTIMESMGACITVTTPSGSWSVPRVYILAHGLASEALPALAAQFGFEEVAA